MKTMLLGVWAIFWLGGNVLAWADPFPGYANTLADLRSGPGKKFPRITQILPETPLEIKGCTAGFDWCDIVWYGRRGWIDGRYLDSIYKGRRVRINQYCVPGELPLITFTPPPELK